MSMNNDFIKAYQLIDRIKRETGADDVCLRTCNFVACHLTIRVEKGQLGLQKAISMEEIESLHVSDSEIVDFFIKDIARAFELEEMKR